MDRRLDRRPRVIAPVADRVFETALQMAYRNPTPPTKPRRDVELEKLTAKGKEILEQQASEKRLALQKAERARVRTTLSREAQRNREIAHARRPWLAPAIFSLCIPGLTTAGIWLLVLSPLSFVVWVHIVIWLIVPATVGLAAVTSHILSSRLGIADRLAHTAWLEGFPFAVTGYDVDMAASRSQFSLRLLFKQAAPSREDLLMILAGIDKRIKITLERFPTTATARPDPEAEELFEAMSALADDSESPRPSKDGSFVFVVKHQGGNDGAGWVRGWAATALNESLTALHRLYPLALVGFKA